MATGGRGPAGRLAQLSLWDATTGGLLHTFGGKASSCINFAFSPDSRLLATADFETNAVRVWSVWTGEQLACFEGHAAPPRCVAFSPDGKLLASGSIDTTILLWDVSKLDGRPPATMPGAEALSELWPELRGNAASAFKAITALSGAGDHALTLIKEHLQARSPRFPPAHEGVAERPQRG